MRSTPIGIAMSLAFLCLLTALPSASASCPLVFRQGTLLGEVTICEDGEHPCVEASDIRIADSVKVCAEPAAVCYSWEDLRTPVTTGWDESHCARPTDVLGEIPPLP